MLCLAVHLILTKDRLVEIERFLAGSTRKERDQHQKPIAPQCLRSCLSPLRRGPGDAVDVGVVDEPASDGIS